MTDRQAGEYERLLREHVYERCYLRSKCVCGWGTTLCDDEEGRTRWANHVASYLYERDQEHARQIGDVLFAAYKYDDKPHHLYSAVRRLAEAHPDANTPEIIRLMDAAMHQPRLLSELLQAAKDAQQTLADWIQSAEASIMVAELADTNSETGKAALIQSAKIRIALARERAETLGVVVDKVEKEGK